MGLAHLDMELAAHCELYSLCYDNLTGHYGQLRFEHIHQHLHLILTSYLEVGSPLAYKRFTSLKIQI